MSAQVPNQERYELAIAILRDLVKLLKAVDDLNGATRELVQRLSTSSLPVVTAPPIAEMTP